MGRAPRGPVLEKRERGVMSFGILMQQILVIFLEVLLGAAGVKCGVITERDSKFLSNFVMKLLLPCTMLASAKVEGGREVVLQMGQGFLLMGALYVLTTGVCLLIGRARGYTPGQKAVLVGTAAMPNCGFVGIPLASAVLGAELGMVYATASMAAYNVWFFTYVTQMFHPGQKMDLKTLATPANAATVAMVLLLATGVRLPAPVQSFCSAVGGCTTPLALLIVGVLLANSDLKALAAKPFLYLVTALRGVIFPAAFMLLLRLLPLDRTLCMGLAVIASCPAGSLAAVLARQSGTEEELASQAVAQSTLFMLVTVPAMLTLAGRLFPL